MGLSCSEDTLFKENLEEEIEGVHDNGSALLKNKKK